MRSKVYFITKNNNDKIEFTEKELQKLLDEVYDDGYKDGLGRRSNYITYTIPNYGGPIVTPNYNEKWWTTVSCSTDSTDSSNVKINGISSKWPSTSLTSKKE